MRYLRAVDRDGNLPCSKCKEIKPKESFPKDHNAPCGYASHCIECHREIVRKNYRKNAEAVRAKRRKYRDANRELIRSKGIDYYHRNKEWIMEKAKTLRHTVLGTSGKAVQMAVQRGELPKAASMYCCRCKQPAQHYHHQSYHIEDRLCVIPVCRSCHSPLNRLRPNGANDLGIVPTRYGLVRIAIASLFK